jgi:short-subunit dehydrogenase
MSFLERYGPWAIVAGASEGIGQAFAEALAERGLNLILLARREDALEAVATPLRKRVLVRAVPTDLSREPSVFRELVAEHDVGLGVYNAALAPDGPFLDQALELKLKVVDTNCRGPLCMADALVPHLVARKRGGLVLMSSLTAFWGSPFLAAYGASKAFNLSLAEALWAELRPHGVDALACCAGATKTPGFVRKGTQIRAMEPRAVAEQALTHLGRGPSMIPGAFNTFAATLMSRVFPRRTAINTMGHQTEKLLKKNA